GGGLRTARPTLKFVAAGVSPAVEPRRLARGKSVERQKPEVFPKLRASLWLFSGGGTPPSTSGATPHATFINRLIPPFDSSAPAGRCGRLFLCRAGSRPPIGLDGLPQSPCYGTSQCPARSSSWFETA